MLGWRCRKNFPPNPSETKRKSWQRKWKINSTKPTPDSQSPLMFSHQNTANRRTKPQLGRVDLGLEAFGEIFLWIPQIRDGHQSPESHSFEAYFFSLDIFFNKMEPKSMLKCV
jgi:hypothetical protein